MQAFDQERDLLSYFYQWLNDVVEGRFFLTEDRQLITLEQLQAGSHGIVRKLEGGKGFTGRLAAMGLAAGARVKMLENRGHGPLLVLVRDTRIALGRSEALKITVEEL